jgi:addiction module RelE/StbE family toxin
MIQWTDGATKDLDHAYDYIAQNNSEAVAERVRYRIVEAVQQLDAFPMSGRTGRVTETRELVIPETPFIAVYTINVERILILAVYHGAQRWPETF